LSELDPQVAARLALQLAGPAFDDPVEARAAYEAGTAELAGAPAPVAKVEDIAGPPPLRVFTPDDAHGTVVFLHGGGWVVGSIDTHDHVARQLANASGARVVLVDYRLAPEHPFPAAVEDAETAFAYARETFGEPLVVAGDSAGGNLAAVLARRHRDTVALQALVYPVLDAHLDSDTYAAFGDGRYGLSHAGMTWYRDLYAPGDHDHPDVSPLRAEDVDGLPPAALLLASHDVLRAEGEAYAERLGDAGVRTRLTIYDGTVHGFLRWTAVTDIANTAIADLGGAIRATLGPPPGS
jgi:acetyl esterase